MRPRPVIRLVGLFLLLFSLTLLPPAAVSLVMNDGQLGAFALTFGVFTTCGLALWLPARGGTELLRRREAFLVAALFWMLPGTLASLPFIAGTGLSVTDAVFEAVSGFTATGATTLIGLEALPRSILLYRQQLQWYGGLGIVVLALALLPMLGVGGMQLYRAEVTGQGSEEKLTPRLIQTARFMVVIYLTLTGLCAGAYRLAGMSPFDAVAHSLSTVSTGGFSTHDGSIGWFASPAIEAIAIGFMLIGAVGFNTHFLAVHGAGPRAYRDDPQTRTFLLLVLGLTAVAAALLLGSAAPLEAIRRAIFQVTSVLTTTGFLTDDFRTWPFGLPMVLVLASFVGGCTGSTAGGFKVLRAIVLVKAGIRELRRLTHPSLVQPIRLGSRPIGSGIPGAVWGFFSIYVLTFAALMVALMALGLDQATAFGAVASSLNNLGAGLAGAGAGFEDLSSPALWVCTFAMLLGRLEILTLLVLLTPTFWRA